MPNPFEDEDLYSSIVLAGVRSPGQVTLSGHNRKVVWDVKAGPSQQGASMDLKEIPPIEFTATFSLFLDLNESPNEFELWDRFAALIESTVRGASPKALDIYHPDLAAQGITSVVQAELGGIVRDELDPGRATVTVKFQEYAPPRKKGGAPAGSKKKLQTLPDEPAKPDPLAQLNAELAAVVQQYKDTGPWKF